MIDAQLTGGYESSGGFRDAFARIMGAPSTQTKSLMLTAAWIDTPLGPMMAIADEQGLYLLEFVERRGLEREIERLRKTLKAAIAPGENAILKRIGVELAYYFSGKEFTFTTPLHVIGSPFQKSVWRELTKIPVGETRSYLDVAKSLNKPTACRAVARANATNQLALVIPCHRVINANGKLGGYAGGIDRKQWLLDHERNHKTQ